MSGMVFKDFYIIKATGKYYIMLFAMFLLLTIFRLYTLELFSGILVMLLLMLPANTFAYDDLANWDKYAVASPAGRRGVVAGKYAVTLLLAAGCLLLSLLINTICFLMGLSRTETLRDLLLIGMSSVCIGTMMNAVLLPLLFKLGAQKSRIALVIVVALGFCGVMLLGHFFNLREWDIVLLIKLSPVGAVALMALSYFISLGIFQKKEL